MNNDLVQTLKKLSFGPSLIPLRLRPIMTTLKIPHIPEFNFNDDQISSPMSVSPKSPQSQETSHSQETSQSQQSSHTLSQSPTSNNLTSFNPEPKSGRGKNDGFNKARERIISDCINGVLDIIPGSKLDIFRKNLDKYLNNLLDPQITSNSNSKIKKKCVIKAGRKYNYDFEVEFIKDQKTIQKSCLEFKYNAQCVSDCPQYVSPMKPSQYMSQSYEKFYYQKYLPKLCQFLEVEIPSLETYLKEIHSPSSKSLKILQDTYYQGCPSSSKYTADPRDIEFYNLSLEQSKASITDFLSLDTKEKPLLDIDLLNNYLLDTQKNKEYMLYYQGEFYYDKPDLDHFKITSYTTKGPYFICQTKSQRQMKILLRWKNGNGIAFPAFQIS